MSASLRETLLRQLDIAWRLASYHLDGLTTEECLWRPAPTGPHVRRGADGTWHADWPDREDYGIGPPSIAWITWHMAFWWSMALDHAFGGATLAREDVAWPGTAEGVRDRLGGLHRQWRDAIAALPEAEFASAGRTRWPFRDRPFADVVAWANAELVKNAAELGYARFLHAAGSGHPGRRPG
jgi:hypothetical protein